MQEFLLDSMETTTKGLSTHTSTATTTTKMEYHLQGSSVTLKEARGGNLGPHGQLQNSERLDWS